MTTSGTTATLLATVLLIGTVAPVAAVTTSSGGSNVQAGPVEAASGPAATGGVNVSVGQQLSTVVVETDSDVRSDVEETTFEVRFEGSGEDEQAAAVADRAAELAERAIAIHEDYEAATRAHEAGEISDSRYAERIATLNARAEDVVESLRRLRRRATGVSPIALRAEGVTRADLRTVDGRLDAVTGTGASALLRRFTGRSAGEVRIETRDGLSIEVEGEDGELSREFERPRDDSTNFSVSQGDALETARTALGTPPAGNWSLERAAVHDDSGYYEFEFGLTGANATGEAEVRVDGSSGDVFRLETEIEAPDDEDERDEEGELDVDDDGDDGRDDDDLALLLSEGTPGPNEPVTLLALSDGEPVADATVTLNGTVVGSTDDNGTLTVTLPADEARLRVKTDDADGELEFEFAAAEREDAEIRRHLDATADVGSGTITVGVSYNGTPVEGATVVVGDREVGTTDANGSVSFASGGSDDLDVEVQKGAFVAELEFERRDGSLTLVEVDIEDADEADRTADDGDGTEADDERSGDDDGTERDEDAEDDGDETETRRETETEGTTERDGELAIRIVEGASEPGATVTVAVTDGGSPVVDAVVFVNDERIGTTDGEGHRSLTLPDEDRVEIVAEHDGEDAELRLEFDDDSSGSGSDGSTADGTDDR